MYYIRIPNFIAVCAAVAFTYICIDMIEALPELYAEEKWVRLFMRGLSALAWGGMTAFILRQLIRQIIHGRHK